MADAARPAVDASGAAAPLNTSMSSPMLDADRLPTTCGAGAGGGKVGDDATGGSEQNQNRERVRVSVTVVCGLHRLCVVWGDPRV